MLMLGIDDSGRGPLMGPMVLAGCLIDDVTAKEFIRLGVKDSKMLTPKRRAMLAEKIKEMAETFEIVMVFPDEIDATNGIGINLNSLEAIKMASVINKINKDGFFKQVKVVVDCPSPNITKWSDFLKTKINNLSNLEISCEHKADQNHVSVSAASILAKITRDAEIEKIKEKIGVDFGSGYASDQRTIKFLEDYFHKHQKDGIFRQTWGTWKDMAAKKEQQNLL